MLGETFRSERAKLVRNLADKADPHIKERLLSLAARYEGDERQPNRPHTPVDLQLGHSNHRTGSER